MALCKNRRNEEYNDDLCTAVLYLDDVSLLCATW